MPFFSQVWCDEALIHQPSSSFIEITVTVFTKSATAPNLYFLRARSPFSTHSETVSLDSHPLRRLIHVPRVLVRLAELGGLKREWCWWLFLEDISVSAPCRTGCWRVTWQVLNPSEDECTHTHTHKHATHFCPFSPCWAPTLWHSIPAWADESQPPSVSSWVEWRKAVRYLLILTECEELKKGRAAYTPPHRHTAGCELRAGMVAEEIVVSLSGGAPWGFRLQGGAEQQKPLQVAKVQ